MIFTKPVMLATIFAIASYIYMLIGLYSLSLDEHSKVNKAFFWMCVTLSIWGATFAIGTQTCPDDMPTARFFQQLAVFGWGGFYPAIYHFFKLAYNNGKKLSKRCLFLIYSPMVIAWIGFFFLGEYSQKQFNMVYTEWGWSNIVPATPLNIFFISYALIFAALTLYYIYKLYRESVDAHVKRRAAVLLGFYMVITSMAVFFDGYMVRVLHEGAVQITELLLLPPVLFMMYVLIKDNVMDKVVVDYDENVMSYFTRVRLFRLLGYVFVFFGYITLYFNEMVVLHKMPHQIEVSVFLIVVGLIHFRIHELFETPKQVYRFITTVGVMMFFLVFIRYQHDGVITMWAVFFFYVLITTIFENMHYTIVIASSMMIIQILYWHKSPRYYFYMDWTDYFGWITLIWMVVLVISFVNKIYRQKIAESLEQIHMQEVFTELSKAVLDIHMDNVIEKSMYYLAFCNEQFGNIRSYYYSVKDGKLILFNYVSNDKKSYDGSKLAFDETFTLDEFTNKHSLLVNSIDVLDHTQRHIKEYLQDVKSHGIYIMIVRYKDEIVGVLVYEFDKQEKNYIYHKYNNLLSNVVHDMINKLNYERDMYYSANYDKITHIRNIDAFLRDVEADIKNKELNYYAILFMDIDNFKSINDAFGHEIGDKVLNIVAHRVSEYLKEENIIARFGGDEFCIFLNDVSNTKEIEERVSQIISLFIPPIATSNYEFKININVGIAVHPEDGSTLSAMLKNADLAMYTSKKIGSMRYHFCDDQDKELIMERALYTNSLYSALPNDEFILAYQPQMSCKTEKIVGAEALIRWKSSEYGLVPPGKFISILEHTGLIVQVGEWIMEQAAICHIDMIRRGLPPMKLSVNLSAIQFQNVHLVESIRNILNKWNIDAAYYELEITESAVSEDSSFIVENFLEIKALGCHIAIDDFGVEFSSLNRLQMLPLDKLKIDQNFIRGIGIDPKKEAIIKFIIELSKSLGLTSTAEGVETKAQKDYLLENECDEIQGYYYGKPMFYEEFEEFVKNNI